MVFSDANEFVDILRGVLPYYLVFFMPILIILSPLEPVLGAHDFTVYRVQQYDLQGIAYGCRSASMNVEARTIRSSTGPFSRRGVLARIAELSLTKYHEIVRDIAGGLIILLPSDLSSLTSQEAQHMAELEKGIFEEETSVPIYFATETPELLQIYNGIESSISNDDMHSAAEAILNSMCANGFQLVAGASQPKPITDVQVTSIWGKLIGHGVEEQLPSIVLVAHYDAFAAAPALAFGADSNGSGVVALFELARLFSRLYSSSSTHAKYNLVFLLSGAGKFNYQGTKKWIDDSLESSEGGLLQDSVFTLCLDTLGSGDELFLHVSKPPKEGTPGDNFLQELKALSASSDSMLKFDMVHKKINLAEDLLSWEHERFSIRRLPAFTISRLASPKHPRRNTLLDTRENVDIMVLSRNVKVVAEALGRHIYNVSGNNSAKIFEGSMEVKKGFMTAWMNHLTYQPRGAQLFLENGKNNLISSVEALFSDFLKEVKLSYVKPDKRDPEFVFYDSNKSIMSAYSVKPALFDLFVSLGIAVYLLVFFASLQKFSMVMFLLRKFAGEIKIKQS